MSVVLELTFMKLFLLKLTLKTLLQIHHQPKQPVLTVNKLILYESATNQQI